MITGWQRNRKGNKPSRSDSRVLIRFRSSIGIRISRYQYYWYNNSWMDATFSNSPAAEMPDEDVVSWSYVER